MRRFDAQHCGLKRIQAEVAPNPGVDVLGLSAVVAEQPDFVRERGVVRGHETTVTQPSQVLRWEERETPRSAKAAGDAAVIARADRLSGILDDRNARLA